MTINRSFIAGFAGALLLVAVVSYLGNTVEAAEASSKATHLFVERATAEKHEPSPLAVSRVMLTADQTDGRFSIVDEVFKPGWKSFMHKHGYHSEAFLIIDGQMKWTVGGETQVTGPGDLVYIPPDTDHIAEVVGDKNVHTIMLYEPGGYELGLRRRVSTPPEKMRDPEFRRQMMELGDIIPAKAR